MINIRIPVISFLILGSTVLFGVLTSEPAFAATVRYVSDQLTIPMRSGASTQYRIIKFIYSGTALTVTDTSDDGKYLHVTTPKGLSGWVEVKKVMAQPSARARIVTLNKKMGQYAETVAQLKKNIADLNAKNRQLSSQYKGLESDKQTLANAYDDLKVKASNPLAIARKNKQLQRDLDQAQATAAHFEQENQHLRDNVMQTWFLIGAGVSLGSLLLGLIITRINWRRKRNSWGDSF